MSRAGEYVISGKELHERILPRLFAGFGEDDLNRLTELAQYSSEMLDYAWTPEERDLAERLAEVSGGVELDAMVKRITLLMQSICDAAMLESLRRLRGPPSKDSAAKGEASE